MPVVDRADRDGVDVFLGEQLAEVFVLVAVVADLLGGLFAAVVVEVADRDELDSGLLLGCIS